MNKSGQKDVIACLRRPETYGAEGDVEVIETHAALVFLCGSQAYKIKRAVTYDYLDYSTLEKRRAALERELELNAPAAPMIYRDLMAVRRTGDGALVLGGDGDPVEWVLRMNRFRTEDELIHVAERGELDDGVAAALGATIASYHAAAPQRPDQAGSILIRHILGELRREFADMEDILPASELASFHAAAARMQERRAGLLDARTPDGHVRRCHGDLHLRNIVLIDGSPVLFDALEFDEELGTCDVLYDLAFLLMDLRHRGHPDAACSVHAAYLREAGSDAHYSGLAALPLFLAVRAAISAMVAVQTARARGTDDGRGSDARKYLRDAVACLSPPRPRLVAIGGLSGTGKTTLARSLAPELGPAPGAVHLRSDLIRKALHGVDPLTRLPGDAYTAEAGARVYQRLEDLARRTLGAGHGAVVDASFLVAGERAAIEHAARELGLPFAGLWLKADTETLFSRVDRRRGDASDADVRVVAGQLRRETGSIRWNRIDASGSAVETLEAARAALRSAAEAR